MTHARRFSAGSNWRGLAGIAVRSLLFTVTAVTAVDLPLAALFGVETAAGSVARGKASTLLVEEPGAVNGNPALLGSFKDPAVKAELNGVLFASGDLLLHTQLLFGGPFAWSAGFKHLSSDAPAASGSGEAMGNVNARLMEFQLAAGGTPFPKLRTLSAGASAQVATMHLLGYERFMIGLHAGVNWEVLPKILQLSFVIRNAGIDSRAVTSANPNFSPPRNDGLASSNLYVASLPLSLTVGTRFHPRTLPALGVFAEIGWVAPSLKDFFAGAQSVADGRVEPRIGAEYRFSKDFTLSLGWINRNDASVLNGFAGGFRLDLPPMEKAAFWVKYAVEPSGIMAVNHYVGVGAVFK